MRRPLAAAVIRLLALAGLAGGGAHAADDSSPAGAPAASAPPDTSARFALYWQATFTEQGDSGFHDPYSGPNSLTPHQSRETADSTLFAGARLWPGAELWINPEVDQGFGLDQTLGVAAFPSAEAYKIGSNPPYFRLQRAFIRDTWNLGGPTQAVDTEPNQFAASLSENRIVLSVGKISAVDIFDGNQYAHDPKNDFLNWAVVDTGTFDYAADSWGYTVGGAAEWYTGAWTLRAGIFDLSDIPNSPHLESGFDEFQIITELERRYELFGRAGKILVTGFDSRGRMGLYSAAIDYAEETGAPVSTALVRSYRTRLGASMSWEQQIAGDLGAFARLGKAQGNVETYEFTDIDRTVAVGLSLKGSRWRRPDDSVGVAGVTSGISADFERYLNAGGLGPLIGDGRLPHPGPEQVLETYYELAVIHQLHLTLDYQFVEHPGYNRDRGPVSITALRVHVQL